MISEKIKNHIYALAGALVGILMGGALVGCDNSDEPNSSPDSDAPSANAPSWTVPAESDCATAPDWKACYPEGNDALPEWTLPDLSVFPTSMAAVIRLPENLEPYMSNSDILGAFINGECRGLAATDQVDGTTLWFMVFKADDATTQTVEFRYYNAKLKRTYIANDGVKYVTNGSYGNLTAPAVPSFEKNLRLQGHVMIPQSLIGYSSVNDYLALFVGDECRSVGTLANNGTYEIDAFVLHGEEFSFRYYNSRLKYLFSSNADEMLQGRELGSLTIPYNLDFSLSRCHPLKVNLTLRLPDSLANDASEEDIVGVFVGDECRGMANYSAVMQVQVRASVSAESYVVRYYNSATGSYYRSCEALPMPVEDAGTALNPLVPELMKESL